MTAAIVPTLSRRDVKSELEALHAERHRALHTALLGQADMDLLQNREVEATVLGATRKFRVAEASCELALREALAGAGEDTLALLITYPCLRLPHDIAARVAGGDVRTIDRSRRLASLFQAQRVAPDVLVQGPLVAALLDGGSYVPVTGTTLDAHTAWRALLGRLGVRGEALASEVGVLEFAARSVEGPILAAHLAKFDGLRLALATWLQERVGPVAAIAFEAWLRDEGRRVAALSVLLEACVQAIPENGYLRARMKGMLERISPSLGEAVGNTPLLARWAGLAAPLLLRLERFGEAGALLDEAARLLPDAELAATLSRSRNLPVGWEGARTDLAQALVAAVENPGRASAQAARAAFDRLRDHRFADRGAEKDEVERLRAAVRLVTWLGWRVEAVPVVPEGAGEHEVVSRLASWYVAQGGFVDLARRVSRAGGADAVGEAIRRVLAAVDAARDEDDRRFARALPAWERRSGNAVPIEAALDRIAVPFLEKAASRRLLVVLLDGTSWAVALELLEDLERFEVGLVRGQPWLEARSLHPVVAALPTLTEVSRAAFFAGKRPKQGEALATSADPGRFANHKGLGAIGTPRLLLAGDAVEPGGGLTKTARELVASDERVVGLVVNAVDDQLRGGPQLRPHYGVEDIRPMRDIVREAQLAGRAILLASDHGHVPGARLQYVAAEGQGGGARWRPLAPGEQPGPKEVAIGGEAAWRRRGVDRVALLWAEDACYSAGAREGEHGGASLAEVIAPAMLIASAELARAAEAEGEGGAELEVRPLPRPKWWDLEAPPPAVQAAPVPSSGPARRGASTAQVSLPFAGQPPATGRVESAAVPAASDRFAWLGGSKVLEGMLATHPRVRKDLVLLAVRTLAEQEGRMPPEVFANRIGELPRRIGGVVSHLQEVLNLEGYPVLKLDRGPGGLVELDLRRLEELFREERADGRGD